MGSWFSLPCNILVLENLGVTDVFYALVMLLIVQDVGKFMVQFIWGLRKHISNQVQSNLYTMEVKGIMKPTPLVKVLILLVRMEPNSHITP